MDPVLVVLVVLVVGGLVAAWFVLRNRRTAPVDDEWTLPPEEEPAAPAGEPVRQVLTRESLVDPDRRLDPSKWDNSPDGMDADVEGDLPTHFDREYLRRRQE